MVSWMELVKACPMCSAPVTLGGGITITNLGLSLPGVGLKKPSFSHHSYHAVSTFFGSYDLAIGTTFGSLKWPRGTARAAASAATSAGSASFSPPFFFLGLASPEASFAAFAASISASFAFFASSFAFFAADSAAFFAFFAAALAAASEAAASEAAAPAAEAETARSASFSAAPSADSVTGPGPGAGKARNAAGGTCHVSVSGLEAHARGTASPPPRKAAKCFHPSRLVTTST